MKKLAIITTHPIQYNAPVFKLINGRKKIEIKVFYTWGEQALHSKYDPGFGKHINWDIPLLEGYEYHFTENIAKDPGSHHFKGIDNPNIISEIEDWGADAILVYGWSFKSHLKILRHFKGKKTVLFRGDSTLLDDQTGVKKILRTIFLKWVYRHIDKALYVGSNNKNYYLAHGLKEADLILAPHAIDNERFKQAIPQDKIMQAKTSYGFVEEDFIVLFAGKLEPKKNPEFLIQLGEELSLYPNTKFFIVGNGILEDKLKAMTKGKDQYFFLEFQNQQLMPLIYKMADVFILPSSGPGETWGLALNEAMACGLPVIASNNCGGAVDLIDETVNGITFAPTDVKKVKEYLIRLYQNKDYWHTTQQYALKKIEQFTFIKIAEAIESSI